MTKNQIISFNAGRGFDSRLIVFLNYQSAFLVFSRSQIDVYDASLAHTMTFGIITNCIVDFIRTPFTQTTDMKTSHTFHPIRTSFSATTLTLLALGR